MSHLLATFPKVKQLLDRVTSRLSGELRRHSTQNTRVVKSPRTACLYDMMAQKTGSVEDISSII